MIFTIILYNDCMTGVSGMPVFPSRYNSFSFVRNLLENAGQISNISFSLSFSSHLFYYTEIGLRLNAISIFIPYILYFGCRLHSLFLLVFDYLRLIFFAVICAWFVRLLLIYSILVFNFAFDFHLAFNFWFLW